jgi:hypothetical protein
MRIANDRDLRTLQKLDQVAEDRRRIERHRATVMRQRPSLPTALDCVRRHHLKGAHIGIADIVEQHGNILAELRRESEAEPDMRLRVLHTRLDPWNAANHVGPEFHRIQH